MSRDRVQSQLQKIKDRAETTSHHPKHQKLTVAKTLLSRINTHITDNTQKHSELQNIRSSLPCD